MSKPEPNLANGDNGVRIKIGPNSLDAKLMHNLAFNSIKFSSIDERFELSSSFEKFTVKIIGWIFTIRQKNVQCDMCQMRITSGYNYQSTDICENCKGNLDKYFQVPVQTAL